MKTLHCGLDAAEICRRKGWIAGTKIVGDEGHGPEVIEITAVGRRQVLAVHVGDEEDSYENSWSLDCREWTEASV